jgi:hypothetical protein
VPFVDLFHEPAVMQRVEEPEAHDLAETRSFDHVAQAQYLSRRLKRLQNRGGVQERLDEIAIESSLGHGL